MGKKGKLFGLGILLLVFLFGVVWYGFSDLMADWMVQSERAKAGLAQKAVTVADHRIVYLDGGKGETVVLVHGFGGDKDNWTRFAGQLTGNYHVIAVDLPGFGESTRDPKASYTYELQVERLHALFEKLNLNQVNLVGNSMGGQIVGLYAVTYPEQVKSVSFFDAAGVVSPKPSELTKALNQSRNPLLVNKEEDFDRLIAFNFSNPPYIPGPLKQSFAKAAVAHRAFNQKIFNEIIGGTGKLQPRLGEIKAPSLILWGAEDRVLDPSSVPVFEAGLKDHTTVILPNCGHLPMLELPTESEKAYRDFLTKD
ncbi:MAG: alpha/beta fold hydrolase [Solirubrobacterales bacterium]